MKILTKLYKSDKIENFVSGSTSYEGMGPQGFEPWIFAV